MLKQAAVLHTTQHASQTACSNIWTGGEHLKYTEVLELSPTNHLYNNFTAAKVQKSALCYYKLHFLMSLVSMDTLLRKQ